MMRSVALLVAAMLVQGAPVAFQTIDKGTQSGVQSAREAIIRDAPEWAALWQEHAPARPRPEVNFAHEMIVGVFLGRRSTAGYAVEIVGIEQTADGLVVHYRETSPARGAVTAQVLTSPYHLVAVPTTDGAVSFEKE
jgi:hypothetical protein